MSIDLDRSLNLMGSRQGETNYDQQRDKSANSVDQFLHVWKIPYLFVGAGLFHRKDTLGTMRV